MLTSNPKGPFSLSERILGNVTGVCSAIPKTRPWKNDASIFNSGGTLSGQVLVLNTL